MAMPAPPVWTEGALTLRPARPADRAGLVALLSEMDRHYWQAPKPVEMPEAAADALLGDASGCAVGVADCGGALIGLVTYTLLHPAPGPGGTLFMKDLFVTEAQRGGDLGARMMDWMTAFASDQGCHRFDWTAETDNPRAMAFYERLGAVRVAEKVYYRIAPQVAENGE